MEEINTKKSRKVEDGDYVKGHLVYLDKEGKQKETTFDFYIVSKEKRSSLIELLKLHNLGENIIVDTNMPIGNAIYGKLTNTTFIVGDSKFYIDEIYTLDEMIAKKEKSKI